MVHFYSRILTLAGLVFFSSASLLGQNLILNPSFENYKACPSNITNFNALVEDVSLPTSSSGDYFNSCGSGDFMR